MGWHFQGNFASQILINNVILFKGVFFKRITSFYPNFISINAFLKEYLSHGYVDRRRGVLDSTVWRIYWGVHSPGGRVHIPHLGCGGRGGLSLKQVTQFHYLASWTGCLLLTLSFKQDVNIRWWSTVYKCDFIIIIIIIILNLIPWCQFKEMDQGHEMSFLILNREVKRMVFCLTHSLLEILPKNVFWS